ncbi:fad binding domain containing protein [Diaporthe eres]|uniref:Uncharacterized protein n=1 Tax=Diaporthe vaccinii TaxID=105482 RepID=A0ABR4E0Y6_9PEZI|nr:fad binding domain containing protein [Diaporthe eres]
MCYQINEHHLIHNIRPCVSYSGLQKSVQLVNPYSTPKPCCEQSAVIARWFACPYGHGCCYLTSRIVKCTAAQDYAKHCDILTQYHTYEERVPLVEQKVWPSLPILDEDIGLPENSHELFPPHHQTVFEMGSEVEDLGEALEQLVSEFFTTKATYDAMESGRRCDGHDVCERVLQHHECREFALREELREIQEKLVVMESEISALEVKFAVRRLRFDATAFGYAGSCDITNLSLKL